MHGICHLYLHMPNVMKIRGQTVEHPFGTIKHWTGTQHLLTKGIKNVRTEVSLNVLAYIFKRMMDIWGVKGLMNAMAT